MMEGTPGRDAALNIKSGSAKMKTHDGGEVHSTSVHAPREMLEGWNEGNESLRLQSRL